MQVWQKDWLLNRIREDSQLERDDDNRRLGEQFKAEGDSWDVVMNSSAIDHILYDPVTEHLQVKFQKGKKYYDFPYVPRKLVEDWINTPGSKGEFYHNNIQPYSVM